MKKALVCGLNHFEHSPEDTLAGCIPDAASMEIMLQEQLGVQVLKYVDKEATKERVLTQLSLMVAEAIAGSLSYLAFTWSGHGTHYSRPEEEDGLGEALVCYDIRRLDDEWDPRTIIKDSELKDLLNAVPGACRVEVWLDTCYSGGMDRLMAGTHRNRFVHNPGNIERVLRISNTGLSQGLNSNISLWCASSEAQVSADAYIAGGAHGAFTYYWLQEYKRNSTQSRVSLLVQTRRALARGGYAQVPRLKAWNAVAQLPVGG